MKKWKKKNNRKDYNMIINQSPTLMKYKETMRQCLSLYYPTVPLRDLDAAIDYSINKRLHDSNVQLTNSYKRTRNPDGTYQDLTQNVTLLELSDYIASREPIVTAFGTMFMHHETVPNPLIKVVQSFLDNRTKHKKMMFQYPKGSEQFEKYNLMQQLDKIDANGYKFNYAN